MEFSQSEEINSFAVEERERTGVGLVRLINDVRSE
jgi:hypothetical protein